MNVTSGTGNVSPQLANECVQLSQGCYPTVQWPGDELKTTKFTVQCHKH